MLRLWAKAALKYVLTGSYDYADRKLTLYRVDEKWAAISSYTACTFWSSYTLGSPSTVAACRAPGAIDV